jgi:urea transporter
VQQAEGFLNSYSQVFFSDNRWLAWFLVVVSFFDPTAGIAGAIAVVVANGAAQLMGYNNWFIHKGFYGYTALLGGLGFGLTFQPGWAFTSCWP